MNLRIKIIKDKKHKNKKLLQKIKKRKIFKYNRRDTPSKQKHNKNKRGWVSNTKQSTQIDKTSQLQAK